MLKRLIALLTVASLFGACSAKNPGVVDDSGRSVVSASPLLAHGLYQACQPDSVALKEWGQLAAPDAFYQLPGDVPRLAAELYSVGVVCWQAGPTNCDTLSECPELELSTSAADDYAVSSCEGLSCPNDRECVSDGNQAYCVYPDDCDASSCDGDTAIRCLEGQQRRIDCKRLDISMSCFMEDGEAYCRSDSEETRNDCEGAIAYHSDSTSMLLTAIDCGLIGATCAVQDDAQAYCTLTP